MGIDINLFTVKTSEWQEFEKENNGVIGYEELMHGMCKGQDKLTKFTWVGYFRLGLHFEDFMDDSNFCRFKLFDEELLDKVLELNKPTSDSDIGEHKAYHIMENYMRCLHNNIHKDESLVISAD